jgi:Fe-Mn family superoxide dismutase
MQRRVFLSLAGLGVLSACMPGTSKSGNSSVLAESNSADTVSSHKFLPLPFAYNALEPYIDARTVEIHYDKHHRGYFKKFSTAVKGTELEKMPMHKIFANVSSYSETVKNYGGGYYNHMLYWQNLSPDGGKPCARFLSRIVKQYGSLDNFKAEFNKAAKTLFGSGWAWLIMTPEKELKIVTSANQDNPLMDTAEVKGVPLLTIDVWEHSYYLKYQNRRADYINNFWNIVNWNIVNERFLGAKKGTWMG